MRSLRLAVSAGAQQAATDPLSDWNEGPAEAAIVYFVKTVTTPGTPTFLPEAERIAVFDSAS